MRVSVESPRGTGRDPVAVCIEQYLRGEAARGRGRLSRKRREDGVAVSFAEWTEIGEDYDIALVRLATLLLEDERFTEGLIQALRQESPHFHC